MNYIKVGTILVWYIGECMVSLININSGIKEPTHGYQICNTTQILIFGGYVNINSGIKEPTHGYQICNTTQILIFGGYVKVR